MFSKMSEPNKGVLFAVIAHLFWGGMAPLFGFAAPCKPMGDCREPRRVERAHRGARCVAFGFV